MKQRIFWMCVTVLCLAATGCNKKIKKSIPATESSTPGQSQVEQKFLELAQSSDEYGNEENEVTDYDYGTEEDLESDDDNTDDSEYDESDYPEENSDEESASDEGEDDASETTDW